MRISLSLLLFITISAQATAQPATDTAAYSESDCPPCKGWNEATRPAHLYGNTFYVGTRGLSAILIASPSGHVLIDGGLPESAPHISANIASLGFRIQDVKLILNSHAHHDHAGGLAALQRMSGATVASSVKSAAVLRSGRAGKDDPQQAILLAMPPVARVRTFADGDTITVASLRLVAHLTPGHTSGGTTWSWRSCESGKCLDFVYADSQTPVSAPGFLFTRSPAYPAAITDFESGFAKLERMACDVLITPHPGATNLWNRIDRKDGATLVDSDACRRYASSARHALEKRKAAEGLINQSVPLLHTAGVADGKVSVAEHGLRVGTMHCAASTSETAALLAHVRSWFIEGRVDSTFSFRPLRADEIVAETDESICRSLAEAYAKLPGEVFTPELLHVVRVGVTHFVMFDPNVMTGEARTGMIFDSSYVLVESRPINLRSHVVAAGAGSIFAQAGALAKPKYSPP